MPLIYVYIIHKYVCAIVCTYKYIVLFIHMYHNAIFFYSIKPQKIENSKVNGL